MRKSRALPTRTLLAVGGSLALAASVLMATPTASADGPPAPYASSLTNPRLLSFGPDGSLYIAESGVGAGDVTDPDSDTGIDPNAHCVTGGEGTPVCFGTSGAVTRVRNGTQARVLTRLPSLANVNGSSPIGPEDIVVQPGGHYAVSMGAGVDAVQRAKLGTAGRTLGTVLSGRFGSSRTQGADIVKFEYAHNPDGSEAHDSDPAGLLAHGGSYVLADAGGNTLLHATRGGQVHTIAVFPATPFTVPFPGAMQAVPTAVAVGPDGAYYVSQLTGFPFPAGGANIWRVVPGEAPTVWASGLTNVTDLTWSHGVMYAVQLSNVGLLNEAALPMGSLVKVHAGANDPASQTVGGPLPAPYGVAIRGNDAYVTVCSVCGPGAGSVVQLPLS